ncbi:MAG: DUF4386 domain-containing protein [Cyclobacteriaceae bacterium]|jgi:hypothetical protein|nr:DUF4386 domain-containing protein [Flammeovirgaceae bacterium]
MNKKLNILIGILLIVELIAQLFPIAVLGSHFEFPDILRQPASVALKLFHQNQAIIVPAYYAFMASSILYLPITALIKTRVQSFPNDQLWIGLFQFSGIATAIFQVIGLCRWILVVPFLSDAYFDKNTSDSIKPMIELIYETLNHYAGMTIGEHLGFIAMGCWTIALTKVIELGRWLQVTGQLIGFLLIAPTIEQFGGTAAPLFGVLNFIANTFWTVWILLLSIHFLRSKD